MIHYRLQNLVGERRAGIERQIWSRDTSAKLHTHDFLEIVVVTRGCGLNIIDGEVFPVMLGDLQIIRPGSTHTFHTLSELHITNVFFAPYLLPKELRTRLESLPGFCDTFEYPQGVPASVIHMPLPDFPPFLEELNRFSEDITSIGNGAGTEAELMALGHLLMIALAISRAHRRGNIPGHGSTQSRTAHALLSRILDEINRNFRTRVSASDIAAKIGISANYLSEFFRKQTGIAFSSYINLLRICYARMLLTSNNAPNITEIAEQCGFIDSSYFARVYRRMVGDAPSILRKRSRKVDTIRKKYRA